MIYFKFYHYDVFSIFIKLYYIYQNIFLVIINLYKIYGDWGLGIGDWGLGIGPNPQSPIPNPQLFKLILPKKYFNIYYKLYV